MFNQYRLAATVAIFAIVATACTGASASPAPSATPPAAGTATPPPTPSAVTTAAPTRPAPSVSIQGVADVYSAFVTASNEKFMAAGVQFDAAGNDVEKLKAVWAATADIEERFVAGLLAIAWPPELRDTVDKLAAADLKIAEVQRALAADPLNADLNTQAEAAGAAHMPFAQELRSRLGLDALATEPPASPSTAP